MKKRSEVVKYFADQYKKHFNLDYKLCLEWAELNVVHVEQAMIDYKWIKED